MEQTAKKEKYRAIAYVTAPASESWRWIGTDGETPVSEVDVNYVTHVNYAFGMIKSYRFDPEKPGRPLREGNQTSKEAYRDPADGKLHFRAALNGWIEEMETVVQGEKYLQALVRLKEKKPELKVLLSIGGWHSDGFCYMAAEPESRAEFIRSCISLIREYELDGIDLDWEYPTNGEWAGIAHCGHCVEDGRALLREFRKELDLEFQKENKLLTIASGCTQPWVDEETFPALDYMNVMCYDYNPGSDEPQASLEKARIFMKNHADMVGNTKENRAKINMGVPFYNGGGEFLVPYFGKWNGIIDADPEKTREKMDWVKENGYGGGFYWAYGMDKFAWDEGNPDSSETKILQRTLYETLNGK